MGFKEAVRTCLREKYVTFSGRAPRSEYWWFQLFYYLVLLGGIALIMLASGLLFSSQGSGFGAVTIILYVIVGLVALALTLPSISVMVRRFHDRNLSGWWVLAVFVVPGIFSVIGTEIPGLIITVVSFVITVLRGTDGPNKYGPDPLNPESRAEVLA